METIRTAKISDLPELTTLDNAVFGDKPYPEFFFRQALELWPDFLLVAESELGMLCGYILAAPSTSPGIAWILSLAVKESSRGKGVGKMLTNAVREVTLHKRFTTIRLTTHPNGVAVGMYETLGFRVTDRDSDYFQDGDSRVIMELSSE